MPREASPPESRPTENDDRTVVLPDNDRLRNAAGHDAEGGRNSGRASDDTREST